jgi:hypothetical protein
MRLFEFINALREGAVREFIISLWVDYEAHNGNLGPDEFAEKSEWLENKLSDIAENWEFEETGSGGFIGSAGGERDVSYETSPMELVDAIYNALFCSSELDQFKKELENTTAKMGLGRMSIEFSYNMSLDLCNPTPDTDRLTLGNLDDMRNLDNGTISIEQLIDAASDEAGINESSKSAKKVVVKVAKPRNPVLQHAHISGRTAGPHTKKGYDRNKEKRKSVDD